ncbi:MFS transporter [Streptomyces sp. NPDC054794]
MATVMGGLTVATAIGVPIGSFIGGTMNWRATMWLVAALGAIALVGVTRVIPHIHMPIPTKLRDRLAPLGDRRVIAALALVMLAFSSFYALYTYLGPVLNPATGGKATKVSVLLCAYGTMAVVGNTIGGKLADTRDPRRVRFTLWLASPLSWPSFLLGVIGSSGPWCGLCSSACPVCSSTSHI